jgi:geranylgeranylglycerol-phosphate geranylgeranyltransferase
LDSSLLGFLAIFLSLLARTKDLTLSFTKALPFLFICICTFIANDVDDVEKDRINHPERPLPSGHLSPTLAVILYFIFLALALFSTRYYVEPYIAFWYYGLITLSISYRYIVDWLPNLKTFYVAVAVSIPILMMAASYPNETRLYTVAGSVFLLTLGREICGNIQDRAGDSVSFMHRINPNTLAVIAFCLQVIGLLLLATEVHKLGDAVDLIVMILLQVVSGFYWFKFTRYRRATNVMKLQFLVGLYFLA